MRTNTVWLFLALIVPPSFVAPAKLKCSKCGHNSFEVEVHPTLDVIPGWSVFSDFVGSYCGKVSDACKMALAHGIIYVVKKSLEIGKEYFNGEEKKKSSKPRKY